MKRKVCWKTLYDPLESKAVGLRVRKKFGRKWYHGTVMEYLPSEKWYLVKYDDGDSEDVTWEILQRHMTLSDETNIRFPQPEQSGPGSKRRRRHKKPEPTQGNGPDCQSVSGAKSAGASDRGGASHGPEGCEGAASSLRGSVRAAPDVEKCLARFEALRKEAVVEENARVERSGGRSESGKKQSRRPDLVALRRLREEGGTLGGRKVSGDVPGIPVGFRFLSRAEMAATGFHFAPVAGIEYTTEGGSSSVTSIVVAGNYEGGHGDENASAGELIYDGAGGCDLLHSKRQIADQILERGNLALTESHRRRIPVRVTRKNKCPLSYTKSVFTYDGLWDVVEWWSERPVTEFNPGFLVYRFRLRRREGQPVARILTKEEEKAALAQAQTAAKANRDREKEAKAESAEAVRKAREALQGVIRQTSGLGEGLAPGHSRLKHSSLSAPLPHPPRSGGGRSPSSGSLPSSASDVTELSPRDFGGTLPKHHSGARSDAAAPAEGASPRQPPKAFDCQQSAAVAFEVAEFLAVFGHTVLKLPRAGDGAPDSSAASGVLAVLRCHEAPVGAALADGFLRPLYTALLEKAAPPEEGDGVPRPEPVAEDEALRLARWLPPGAAHLGLDAMDGRSHLQTLQALCNAVLASPEVHDTLDLWAEERAAAARDMREAAARETRRLKEAEAAARSGHGTGRSTPTLSAVCADDWETDIGTLRRLQREAKEAAGREGRLRVAARKRAAEAVALEAERAASNLREIALRTEERLGLIPLRRQPVGFDQGGGRYWRLSCCPEVVVKEDTDGEWSGYYDAVDFVPFASSLVPCEPSQSVHLNGIECTSDACLIQGPTASDV
uniref:Euchromatic histone-lysine N-methyltransferase n=1 Tax=Tetraselmis sp. GSL018 TaxID=582737 RepID=A0A061RVR8_9CHLO|eukprot:CAMPEP_0177608966 /NCGR_PEP_ID=MMETSP0419_2-20121207/18785_1 /TAXON_ID=582737 /ORGANISM="Tetraselmis sp., Strain GSL018" /LENGTH=839 /DNA_ID=CAMNT_0019103755 /DNA_START=135 /DNA_END=2654 /DNA_ORIENTATION=-